ncbi:MAG: hypothetical protein HYX40_11490 [Sphingobacteriales bacterium]|nr:hypothetical protein [Sphingobacteriales bacterium]
MDIKIKPAKKFPFGSYYGPSNRYWADSLLSFLQLQSNDTCIYLGVTSKDISTTKGNIFNYGVMGLGLMSDKASVISTYRLGNTEKLNQCFYKLALHEIGHNSGLPHCKENSCYMLDTEGRMKFDSEYFFRSNELFITC